MRLADPVADIGAVLSPENITAEITNLASDYNVT